MTRSRRICGFREIKGRKEKVQWLIVPKDSPTVRQGVPICSPPTVIFSFFRFLFFFLCPHSSVQVGHSILARIHLHPSPSTGVFITRVCHLVTLRARSPASFRSQEDREVRGKTFYRGEAPFSKIPSRYSRERITPSSVIKSG